MISKHFQRSEFLCGCYECGFDAVDAELLMVLEDLRDHYCLPVRITSGCRCRSHNDYVGGSPLSKHCLGTAADVVVVGIDPHDVFKYLEVRWKGLYGLGDGRNFSHVDMRANATRWSY